MYGFLAIAALTLTTTDLARWVAWDYDLATPPDGWTFSDEWTFPGTGTYLDEYVNSPWASASGEIISETIVIPENCDSIVFHVEQDIDIYMSGIGGNCSHGLYYRLDGGSWETLFFTYFSLESTEPFHYVIPASEGQTLDFKFKGAVWCGTEMYPGSASIDWLLYDLTLTFWGDVLSFDQTTWGAIKRSVI